MELPQRYQLDPGPGAGRGRVVQVLTGTDRLRSLPVAIGVLRDDLPDRAALAARFDAEVAQTAFVSHARWWPRHDHGRTPDGLPFVVTPLASSSFAEYRARPPQWDELCRLLLEVIDGLAWLHARDRVHGNLKPDDLLLAVDPDGRLAARLTDAHLGGVVARAAGRRHSAGAPGYAAPEQRRDRPVSRGADLFALGVITWEVVTGARPFAGDPLDAQLPPFAPRFLVPPRLETVLANLLHPNPLGRYDLAADVRTELSALGSATAGGTRDGTVAPSFVAARPITTDETLDEVSFRGMTAEEVLSLPPWNRPLPPPIPEELSADRLDADAPCASIAVRVAREIAPVGRGPAREALWAAAREVAQTRGVGVVVVH
ncbi:MAG: protein kinase, partial [Myxococcota bacterium]